MPPPALLSSKPNAPTWSTASPAAPAADAWPGLPPRSRSDGAGGDDPLPDGGADADTAYICHVTSSSNGLLLALRSCRWPAAAGGGSPSALTSSPPTDAEDAPRLWPPSPSGRDVLPGSVPRDGGPLDGERSWRGPTPALSSRASRDPVDVTRVCCGRPSSSGPTASTNCAATGQGAGRRGVNERSVTGTPPCALRSQEQSPHGHLLRPHASRPGAHRRRPGTAGSASRGGASPWRLRW